MDLTPLPDMIERLAQWRHTVAAAEQDVREAEEVAILADVKLGKARQAQQWAICEVQRVEAELASYLIDVTKPAPNLFSTTE